MFIPGKSTCITEKLLCGHGNFPHCDEYDDDIDLSNSPEFAHSTFRLSHSNIPDNLEIFDEKDNVVQKVPISDLFQNFTVLEDKTKYNVLLNSILKTKIRSGKKGYSNNVNITTSNYLSINQFIVFQNFFFEGTEFLIQRNSKWSSSWT